MGTGVRYSPEESGAGQEECMTAIDTNIFVAFWGEDERGNRNAQEALDEALSSGLLIVAAPVYAELLGRPSRTGAMLDEFFMQTGIKVDWNISEQVWRLAGTASLAYNVRRRASKGGESRRILADFVIGAHAVANGCSLLTLDRNFFERNFPGLVVKTFS